MENQDNEKNIKKIKLAGIASIIYCPILILYYLIFFIDGKVSLWHFLIMILLSIVFLFIGVKIKQNIAGSKKLLEVISWLTALIVISSFVFDEPLGLGNAIFLVLFLYGRDACYKLNKVKNID